MLIYLQSVMIIERKKPALTAYTKTFTHTFPTVHTYLPTKHNITPRHPNSCECKRTFEEYKQSPKNRTPREIKLVS